ncbi:hypothetical protein PAXRUDRAFT_835287 [Paxillus rubicundulus Ve08.2h10]|uniref:Uncharacterized protein n=1 Tax=Paxillus rubicundulus Ve08.2h10 TaxID=930991 RepID=A0A0D0CZC8_9AGAM|nr:hypothetical protein PAXRUDRAFT_835287 [Paxillus rubicundulus Ve08.2h10]
MSQIKVLTGQSALAFLLTHDPEDAHHFGVHIPLKSKRDSSYAAYAEGDLIADPNAFMKVKTISTSPIKQEIAIRVPNLKLTFTYLGDFQYGGSGSYPIKDTGGDEVAGTIYIRGDAPPPGDSGLNCQQFPSYDGTGKDGRTSIDLWNAQEITAVFKTNIENYAYGSNTGGQWKQDA